MGVRGRDPLERVCIGNANGGARTMGGVGRSSEARHKSETLWLRGGEIEDHGEIEDGDTAGRRDSSLVRSRAWAVAWLGCCALLSGALEDTVRRARGGYGIRAR